MNYLLITLVALSGAGLSVQAVVNAQMRQYVGHSISTAVISFLVGLAVLVIAMLAVGATPSSNSLKQMPWWGWIGGLLGAIFITVSAYSVRSLGTTLFFGIVIASQLTAALLIDHYGLFGQVKDEISIPKIIGIALLAAGTIVIKWKH